MNAAEIKARKEARANRLAESRESTPLDGSNIFVEPQPAVDEIVESILLTPKGVGEEDLEVPFKDEAPDEPEEVTNNTVVAIGTVDQGILNVTDSIEDIPELPKVVVAPAEEPKSIGAINNQSAGLVSSMAALASSVTEINSPEPKLSTEPSIGDTDFFQKLTRTSESTGVNGSDSYAELVENMVSSQCQLSGVKNLDLTTFGLRAQVLTFPNLSVMQYGNHKFLGAPFTEEEENLIIHRLGLHVAQSNKDKLVVRAVQEVKDSRGMSFYSLLFNEQIAQKFANMFNYTVHANLRESDVSKLVMVIQK